MDRERVIELALLSLDGHLIPVDRIIDLLGRLSERLLSEESLSDYDQSLYREAADIQARLSSFQALECDVEGRNTHEQYVKNILNQVYQACYESCMHFETKPIEQCDREGNVINEYSTFTKAVSETHHTNTVLRRLINSGAYIDGCYYRVKC